MKRLRTTQSSSLRTSNKQSKSNSNDAPTAFKLLNTSLGTWVLSAVFLTLGPYIWQELEDHFKQQVASRAENNRRNRLIEEFSYRLSVSYSRLSSLQSSHGQPRVEIKQTDIEWAISPLLTAKDGSVPLFKENGGLAAISILAELNISLINAGTSEMPASEVVVRHLRRRIDAISKIESRLKQDRNPVTAEWMEEYLRSEIDHELWKRTGYSYLRK